MNLHDMRLSTRITVSAMIIVAAGAAALAYVENVRLHEAYLSERRSLLELDLGTAKLRLNQMINTLRQDVLFLSNTPPVSGIVRATLNHGYDPLYGNTHKVWAERLQLIFSAFSSAHPDYYKIRYIGVAEGGHEIVRIENREGKIEVTTPDKLQAKGEQEYFKASIGLHEAQVYLSKLDFNQEDDVIEQPRATLRATAPVFTPSGKIFGMVVISMDMGGLLKSVLADLPGVQTYVTNMDGQYLLHPDSRRAFKFDPDSKVNIAADFPFIKTMFDPQAPDYLPLHPAAPKLGSPLFAARRIHFDLSNPSRFMLFMYYLPGSEAEKQIATIPAEHIRNGLIVFLLVSGIALLVLRRTFSPLEKISAAADDIASGRHNVLLPQYGGGEIGSLTSALNTMLTQLSQREKSLSESEARYRRLHESMMDAFSIVDMSGRFIECNYAYQEMLGYSAEELQHLTFADVTPEKWHDIEAQILNEQVIPLGQSPVYEKEYTRKDGTVFPVELRTFLLRDANNQPEGMWAIVRNITERKQAEQRLLKSSEEISDLYNHAPCGYHSLDKNGYICLINDTELTLLGYTREEVIGKIKWPDIIAPASTPVFQKTFPQLMKQGFIRDVESEIIRKDGTTFTGLINASAIYDREGNYVMSRSMVVDITERKRAERQLQQLSAHLQTIREEEKARIAREIHDELGGTLTALKMEAYRLASELAEKKATTPLLQRADSISQLLDTAVGTTRNIITELRPPILDDLGLLAALEWQAEKFRKNTGINCLVNCIEDTYKPDNKYSIALFRIFQETLTNIARHSGASKVEVEFQCNREEVMLSVSDNGHGLPDVNAVAQTSFGIRGMRERVEQLGGKIKFDNPPDGGFNVTVILPLPVQGIKEKRHDPHHDRRRPRHST
ncbi:MAG: PAS domain S-box protein [Gallionella sp.]|nr:PAS domain S-box protein [Gallionella sp.]